MRFDDAAEKTADDKPDPKAKTRDPTFDTEEPAPIRIPLKIDDAIVVRSLTNQAHIARTRVVGAMHGKFILILEPAVKVNERLSAVLDDEFLCSYFNDGTMHVFHSKYRKHVLDDIVCIDYPKKVEVRQIRKWRRIRVNIETQCTVRGTTDRFPAEMADISQGGCLLVTQKNAPVAKGTNLSLTFHLPNEALVSAIQATAVRVNFNPKMNARESGLVFSGPESEISKVSNFCEFCMYFDLQDTHT